VAALRAPSARRLACAFGAPSSREHRGVDTDADITFEIDERRLTGFVAEQLRLIASTPLPVGLGDELRRSGAGLELEAVWLGAGLATQIGLPLLEHPEAFVRRSRDPAQGVDQVDRRAGDDGREVG
jgi:hypothetical protein